MGESASTPPGWPTPERLAEIMQAIRRGIARYLAEMDGTVSRETSAPSNPVHSASAPTRRARTVSAPTRAAGPPSERSRREPLGYRLHFYSACCSVLVGFRAVERWIASVKHVLASAARRLRRDGSGIARPLGVRAETPRDRPLIAGSGRRLRATSAYRARVGASTASSAPSDRHTGRGPSTPSGAAVTAGLRTVRNERQLLQRAWCTSKGAPVPWQVGACKIDDDSDNAEIPAKDIGVPSPYAARLGLAAGGFCLCHRGLRDHADPMPARRPRCCDLRRSASVPRISLIMENLESGARHSPAHFEQARKVMD